MLASAAAWAHPIFRLNMLLALLRRRTFERDHMAARWVGLSRPQKHIRRAARATIARTAHEFRHALGAVTVLVMAAGMNFALQPDALAEVMRGERSIVGFVPTETALAAIFAPQAEHAQPEIVLDETVNVDIMLFGAPGLT